MALSSITFRNIIPTCSASFYVMTYSKASTNDYFTATIDTPIKTLRFALAQDSTAGAEDPVSFTSTVVTFSAGTAAGRILFIGNC
jgi:hypothetical protein